MQLATAAAVGHGAARSALGHRLCRRRRGAWGRPQRDPVKSWNCKEKTEMGETHTNQDLTGNLRTSLTLLPKTEEIPGSIRHFC